MELVIMVGLFWLPLCLIIGIAANRRYNRSGFGWAAGSFVFSPIFAFLLLAALGPARWHPTIEQRPFWQVFLICAAVVIGGLALIGQWQ